MHPSPARRQPQASEALTAGNPPMSPGSSGELSPFDLLGEIGDLGPGSPTDDGQDGNHNDSSSGQKYDSHAEIAEQAKHEAEIENRIAELRKEGFWTPRRLSKFPEPARPKVHWDYLCEEMQWLAADFAQERRWKRGVARKVVRMVVRHHEELKQKEERARREEQAKLRRIATSIAKEVRQFWGNVEKVVQFKQQSRLEAKRKKALDLQLDFIVGQTEKYSDLLSQSLNETTVSKTSSSCRGSSQEGSLRTSPAPSVCQKDGDFLPHEDEEEEEDDEETIEIEERQDGNDAESHRLELELLKRESELPLDELLQSLPPQILQEEADIVDAESDQDDSSEEEEEEVVVEEDDEFTANEEEAEDEEETIAAEEAMEGQKDHTEELSQLAQEGDMSIEDLLKKYSLVRTDEEETVDQGENSLLSEQEASESSECDSSNCESEGVEFLVKPEGEDGGTDHSQHEPPEPKKEITDIAATAESLQPKGYTLATTQVKTPVPFLLRGELREYQHIGLEWLVTMYEKKLNGILADEMGLGKTIQTISLLAHLACERGNWGPHLIIVPTSVILNWEMELKRWCPSFKILTYYGSQKERKLKRQGWTKANAFHVCITSYKLVLQDHQAFRRKNWRYLILDEAQNIKNFKSQRWQSLLNFNSQRRLLLTGTPLQNSLMELWSLMHFLMPHVFQSHREFKEWFSNPLTGMIEGSQEYNEGLVRRLHKVLRPFLLRRIKQDVEKQMPKKYEHVIYCRLSKRQRFLYDDFMSQAATRESLASGHFMSVINILMQLRKVCNHPNLFDPRPIHSPFITSAICYSVPSPVLHALQRHPLEYVDTSLFDLVNLEGRVSRYESDVFLSRHKPSRQLIQEITDSPEPPPRPRPLKMKVNRMLQPVVKPESRSVVVVNSSRPVQKPQDTPTASPPPPPPSTPLLPSPSNPPPPTTGASGPAQPAPQVPPLVQSSPVAMTTPVSSETGKPAPLQNSQAVYSAPQRFILTPDMQARLPSGEVVSLSQLASLSGRPMQSPSTTKPLTLQLQGAKFTLSGAQVRPVGVTQPRPMQGNVLHLVSSGGQHHLLSQPAQLALIQALAQQAASPAPAAAAAQLVQNSGSAQIGVQTMTVQGLQHPLMNNTNIPPPSGPAMAAPGQVVNAPGVVKIVVRQAPREVQSPPQRPPLAPQVRPVLRVLPSSHMEHTSPWDGSMDRSAPSATNISLASSPLLMVSSPTMTPRLPSSSTIVPSLEDSSTPPLSGVALRLVATGPSPTVQLTNHHSSPPRHSASPALTNCSLCPTLNSAPSNGTATQPMVGLDSSPSPILLKSTQNPDLALLDNHPVQNGNGLQNQLADSLPPAVPMTSVPSTVNSPSPPAANIPKVSPPTYNLSLVPALIANSASSSAARFLTSPVSLLALSPLASTNSGPTPVLYNPPNAAAFPALAAPSLSAPLPSASLPLLATSVSGQLASFAAPLPISSANQNPLTVPHPSVEVPSTVSVLSSPVAAPTAGPLPVLAATATASMLEASNSQPLLLSPDSAPMPLLDSSSDTLPPLVLNTALKLPSMASAPVPILPAPVPNAVPLLAAASGKVPLLSVTSAATNLPLLPASTAAQVSSVLPTTVVTNPLASMRAPGAVASVMFTTSVSSVTNSPSPLLSTSTSLPSLLPKPSAPLLTVQVKAPTLLPSGLVEAPTSLASVPPDVAASCTLSVETPAALLPSAALEPAMVSTLVASVPTPGPCSVQPVLPILQIKAPAPLPSLPASTVTPSMPASAPAPLPSLPASTPIPLPLLTASTPTPMSSLPASSPDPSSLLLVSAPAPDLSSPILAPSVDHTPVSLLPSSCTNPLVISVSAPLTLTASSPSLVLSAPSHIPLLPSQPVDAPPPGITVPKPPPSPSSSCTSHSTLSASPSPQTNTPNTSSTLPTSVNTQESKNFPESSLSLSIAGPPPVSVTFSTASESEITLEGDEPRIVHSTTINTSVRPRRLLPPPPRSPFYLEPLEERRKRQKMERLERIFHLNERRCNLSPVYGTEVLSVCTLQTSLYGTYCTYPQTEALRRCIFTPQQHLEQLGPIIERFIIAMPPVEAPQITLHTSHPPPSMILQDSLFRETLSQELTPPTRCLHRIISNMRTQFPDLRLIQYDCGKLQTLDRLLRELKSGGHRVLLFTQMTRMLDVLEQFLNYHGHIYLRLDGSTRVEQRQVLMERFNMDKRIFCFILSTRSGGVGVNLTGADTVIFYDSDWNPTMDAQAQDRCHRIGQTRDVHIYRLVSERTVEENILKKAQQKRMLGDMAIEGGNFTTAYFKQQTIRELFDMEDIPRKESETRAVSPAQSTEEGASLRQSHILEQALCRAEDEEDTLAASLVKAEQVADLAEFNENVPLEPEEEEQSRVEQEISALVEQLTPIERYAMYFLEASLEEVSREELKQAEEQVEAARKDLILAKDEGGQSIEEKWEEEIRKNRRVRTPTPARPPGERVGVRMSERLRGNKAAEPTDIADSLAVPDISLSAQQDLCDVSTQTLEVPSVTDVDDGSHDAETFCNATATSEPTMSPIAPLVPQTEESTTETIKEEAEDEGPAPTVEQSVPSVELTPGSPEPCVHTPGSPVTAPQEEPTPPRTPRRKVTADCEILMAGASDNSPAAKVLRRLPGRLVTVVQDRLPAARRHVRGRGQQASSDNGVFSPNVPEYRSPPRDLLSDDPSETGSPPPKRKRGRPPKTSTDMSPTAVPDLPVEERSHEPHPPTVISELPPSCPGQTPTSPSSSSKLNSESENSSAEKRKRGRPPKRRESSPATSPASPASPFRASRSPVFLSPVGVLPPSLICAPPTSPIIAFPSPPTSVLRDLARDCSQVDTTEANFSDDRRRSAPLPSICEPTTKPTIPNDSSNIPSVGGEATSSSGADEPVTPSKRRRGRPPRSQMVPKTNCSLTSHNYKLDSSPDRSPSPQMTTRAGQRKPHKAETMDPKEQNSSLADTDDSSEDEVVIRTPLTRSARTRLETSQTPFVVSKISGVSSPKAQRGRSPRVTPTSEKATTKKRKPTTESSPSPLSSSPNDSSSGRQRVARKKRHCSPPERILRSSLTANPASNTRSSRNQLQYFPSSNRGRKAKT